MRHVLWLVLILLVAGCSVSTPGLESAASRIDWESSRNRLSYAAGYKLGDMFQNQKLTLVADAVLKGMDDARRNIRPLLTKGEMKVILRDPRRYLIDAGDRLDQDSRKENEAFLQANVRRKGVVVRESGLQYLVLREGKGRMPAGNDRVRLNYQGKTIDGKVFTRSSDQGRQAELNLQNLVVGMSEGVRLMREGAKWELYIPSELAYADQGPLADKVLIFDVELVRVFPAAQ